ncbi:MAG: hypothetical protein ACP5NU_03850 [Methanomicrobiales archaeon]
MMSALVSSLLGDPYKHYSPGAIREHRMELRYAGRSSIGIYYSFKENSETDTTDVNKGRTSLLSLKAGKTRPD